MAYISSNIAARMLLCIPIRVKGRNEGKPLWGQFETLVDGKWVEYEF